LSGLPFDKYVSIGNDFVFLEEENVDRADVHDLSELAKKLCSRHFGIGSDGLLIWRFADDAAYLRMFNPDGTEDFCGNGLRCAALHTERKGLVKKSLRIIHRGQESNIEFGMAGWIDVQLPKPSFAPEDVPLKPGTTELFDSPISIGGVPLRLCACIVGSTHAVIFCEGAPVEETFQKVSPLLENHELFPERTSVIWSWQEKFNAVRIRIWERGAGETLGCGTGSAATAACYFRKNSNLVAMQVINPGGECAVAKGPDGTLIASTRARHVFSGQAHFAKEKLALSSKDSL
jgi:diaminopimelate epimerase